MGNNNDYALKMFSDEKKKEFLIKMSEALELEEGILSFDTDFSELNWDSLAVITAIAIVDECFGVVISAEKIFYCQNLNDIIEIACK